MVPKWKFYTFIIHRYSTLGKGTSINNTSGLLILSLLFFNSNVPTPFILMIFYLMKFDSVCGFVISGIRMDFFFLIPAINMWLIISKGTLMLARNILRYRQNKLTKYNETKKDGRWFLCDMFQNICSIITNRVSF